MISTANAEERRNSAVTTTRKRLIQAYAPSSSSLNARSGPNGGASSPFNRYAP